MGTSSAQNNELSASFSRGTAVAHFRRPTLYVADNVPGGVGLAEALFDLGKNLFYACLDALGNCKCKTGCPACIGANVAGGDIKPEVVKLLRVITGV